MILSLLATVAMRDNARTLAAARFVACNHQDAAANPKEPTMMNTKIQDCHARMRSLLGQLDQRTVCFWPSADMSPLSLGAQSAVARYPIAESLDT
jgi:hypothetical protein